MTDQHLSDEQLEMLREALEQRRDELRDELAGALERSEDARLNELAGRVRDAGDESLALHAADLNLTQYEHWIEQAQAVERALTNLRAGTYGLCEVCRQPIDPHRLQVEPTALRCLQCQQRHERGQPEVGNSL